MFFENNPNNTDDNNIILIGKYDLMFNITEAVLSDKINKIKNSYEFTFDTVQKKLSIKNTKDDFKFSIPIINDNPNYTLFVPYRLDYLSKDKYFSKYVEITKSTYMINRYVLSLYIYIKKDNVNEIYTGITNTNLDYTYVKDILCFMLNGNRSLLELKINNINNNKCEIYKLVKEYNIVPFNYQLENISWCKNVENNINKKESVEIIGGYEDMTKIDSYFIMNDNVLYMNNRNIIKPECYKKLKHFAHIQGGLLCDTTGLGKTLTLTIHFTDDTTKINTICMERGKMLVDYKESLNSGVTEMMLSHVDRIKSLLDDEYKMLFNNYKLKTNANLLIVPVRLLQQWESEIKRYLPSAKVYLINTVRDFYKLKLDDIEKYQVVIISITFLQNEKRKIHPEEYDLQNILWKRVIVDEVHEIFTPDANSKRNKLAINEIKAVYKWGISATPSLNPNCNNILEFLTNNIYYTNETIHDLSRYRITSDISDYWKFINNYYRYNEIKKVSTEINIPESEEKIIELEMSQIEKLMYNNATGDKKRMIALCTNYKISSEDSILSGFATVSELKDKMLTQHNKKRQEHMDKIEGQKKNNAYIKELVDWFYTDRATIPEHIRINYTIVTGDYYSLALTSKDANVIAEMIDRVTKKLDTNEKYVVQLEKELKLIKEKETMINNFDGMLEEKLNDPCMICFGNFDTAMITICNHMFCGRCIDEMFKKTPNIKCPMCRHPLARHEVNGIVDKNLNLITGDDIKKKIESKEQEKVNMTNGGTKISEIVKYIKECEDKIIVFAMEKQTLDLIGDVMIDNSIKFVNLKGNAYVVSKQLKRFKSGEEKVILLSADRANSGTNLIEASHVILLDTHLIENTVERETVEKQAIGRAVRLGQKKNVKILRFIMKNTIEQLMLNSRI
jgi:SNF2 family DNA or RNA helicase